MFLAMKTLLRMFIANWSVSICLVVEQSFIFSQLVGYNQSLFCRGQFCLSPSISIFYGTSNCWLQFSDSCSKLVNQLSKVLSVIVYRIFYACHKGAWPVNLRFCLYMVLSNVIVDITDHFLSLACVQGVAC